MKFLKTEKWHNQYASGTRWELFNSNWNIELERIKKSRINFCLLFQFGGEFVFYKSITLFGYSLSVELVPLS